MKLFRMLRYGIRDAFKSVTRNLSLSIASISCISITLIVVAFALLVSFNVKNVSKSIEKDVTITVFLNLGVTDEQIEEFENKINSMDNVQKDYVKLTPKDRKDKLISEDDFWSNIGELIDNEDEIFHQAYQIKVNDINTIENVAKEIRDMKSIVNKVDYGENFISSMVLTFDFVEKIAFAIVIILIIVSVFLIINTIKLTIFSRKREISIMRVVGASNLMIKNPFIIEGFILGVLGSVIPIILIINGYGVFYKKMDGHLFSPIIELIPAEPFVYLLSGIILAIGIVVGMLGSARAVRKYLKV